MRFAWLLMLLWSACARPATPHSAAITKGMLDPGDPAVAALRLREPECGTPRVIACTGTLIAPRAVITARHCVAMITIDQAELYFGPDARGAGEIHRAAAFVTHPDPAVDLALIALASAPAAAPLAVRATTLDASALGTSARLIGFGADDEMMLGLKRHGTATVEAVDPATFRVRAAPSQSCGGDSGGPVLLDEQLAGVVSYGDPACAHTGTQVRLDIHAAFINDTLAQIAAQPSAAPAHDPANDACPTEGGGCSVSRAR